MGDMSGNVTLDTSKNLSQGVSQDILEDESQDMSQILSQEILPYGNDSKCSPTSCYECNIDLYDMDTFKEHIKTVHNIANDSYAKKKEALGCNECEKEFYDSDELKEHMNILHQKIDGFFCKLCKKKFKQKASVTRHMKKTHANHTKGGLKTEETGKYESPMMANQLKQELSNVQEIVEAEHTGRFASNFSHSAEESEQQGELVQFFSCTACAKFSSPSQQGMWDHMFSAHVQVQNLFVPQPIF